MNGLSRQDWLHLQAAEGWLMLGVPLEAQAELKQIETENANHPGVVVMRWQTHAAVGEWQAACETSKILTELAPGSPGAWVCHANSIRNYLGVLEAWRVLRGIVEHFPKSSIIHYNLACYAAQLGFLEESCGWLVQAFRLDESAQLKIAAIYDADLQPLWDKIGRQNLFQIENQSGEETTASHYS